MATAKPRSNPTGAPQRRSWPFRLGVAGAAIAFAGLALGWSTIITRARTGAAYGARVGCSCRYLGKRDLHDCRKDFEAGMGLVWLSEDAQARSVTARVPLLASETATFREGEGCMLERWPG